MSLREERMAKNEAASREVNEKIQEAYQGEPPANRIDIVCECARMTCDAAVDIALNEYEDVREDARHFVIIPRHFVGDIEWIVFENDRFAVVAKREGVPADVARDENPRGKGSYPERRSHSSVTLRPDAWTFVEHLIDCEENRTLRSGARGDAARSPTTGSGFKGLRIPGQSPS